MAEQRLIFRDSAGSAILTKRDPPPQWPFAEPKATAIKTLLLASQRYIAIRAAAPEGAKQANISPCFPLRDRTEAALDYATARARERWGNAPAFELIGADAVPFRSGSKLYPPDVALLQNPYIMATLTMAKPPAGDPNASTLGPDMGSDAELLQTYSDLNTREVE